jgi:RNA polymerase sigma factor (sigma-70 family)
LAEDQANRSELSARVAALPARQRSAVVLRYYVGCSDTEIAATLGCREVTVRGYVSRALKALRIELADDVGASERTNHAH